MKQLARLALWILWVSTSIATTACSGRSASDSRAADETAIREADAASLRAIATKQTEATLSYYDEGASILIPNAPIATGRVDIRKAWEQMFAIPGFDLAPKTAKVEVARSGDLAYTQGTYEFAAIGPSGAPVKDRGKFVVVWKKQTDGAWKILADIWNSDLPHAPAPKQ
jgi:ketosteroid isomerase-like protein